MDLISAADARGAAASPSADSGESWIQSPNERVRSGKNYPMQRAMQSPLTSIGIPPAAVPAVATVATVAAIGIWPLVVKTVGTLLKGLTTGHLRVWARRDKKIDPSERFFEVAGFRLRPWELGSLFVAACIYGLALCFAFNGWELDLPLLLQQIQIVLGIYSLRSFVRFMYERRFGVVTVFQSVGFFAANLLSPQKRLSSLGS